MSDTLTIASWNINSVRFRRDIVERFLCEQSPDVLCLQETKARDEDFPHDLFAPLGYTYRATCGQPMHHGVATLSRISFTDDLRHDWQDNGEARHIGIMLTEGPFAGLRIENVYVPAGGDVPDRAVNPKFGQKLDFVERMTRWSEGVRDRTLIVGDFNIAPLESDVWNHKSLLKVVSHTPLEVETLACFQAAHGWVDLGRKHIPAPDRNWTWWSYRAKNWRDGDRGRRLDHMWASADVAASSRSHRVIEETRDWVQCSDHVPLITDFDL